MTAFGGPRGAGYEVIDESKLRRKRTCEAEKSPKKAVVRAYSCSDHGTIIAGRRNRHGARCFGFARYTVSLPLTAYLPMAATATTAATAATERLHRSRLSS